MLLLDHEPLPETVGIPLSLKTLARTREDKDLLGSKCSGLFTLALASGGVQKVQICNWNGERCAFVGNNQLHVRGIQ